MTYELFSGYSEFGPVLRTEKRMKCVARGGIFRICSRFSDFFLVNTDNAREIKVCNIIKCLIK